jgi:cyclase
MLSIVYPEFLSMKTPLLSIACLLIIIATVRSQNFDTVQVRSEQVAGNIYILKGSGGNIGVLTGPDGILMIDDQFLPLSEKIKNAIAALDKGNIRFTLNTHVHGDHTGSNEFFKRNGSTIVAHDLVRERMQKEYVNKTTNQTTPPRDKDAWPVVTFSDKMNLHLNDQDISLIHFAPGHTDGDVIINFKQANVFHMGDVFVTYGYPFIDASRGGSISGLISTLDKVMSMMDDNSKIIPGHGNLSTKADVKKYRDRLAKIRDEVAAALKKGKKVQDIAAMGITDPFDAEWGKGFLKGKDFVVIVAEGLNAEKTK